MSKMRFVALSRETFGHSPKKTFIYGGEALPTPSIIANEEMTAM